MLLVHVLKLKSSKAPNMLRSINESRVAGTIFSVPGYLNVRGHLRTMLCHYLWCYFLKFRLTLGSGNKPV
jgi:hypothetical protein